MTPNPTMNIPSSLNDFLHSTDLNYKKSLALIPLFNPEMTGTWDKQQKKYFASIFYHLRGHFINFVWYIANFCNDEHTKTIILNNMYEELGVDQRFSHESLYERFAIACGADIHDEIINETHYLPFAREFNKTHLEWLSKHDNEERIAAFAAYERLDNLDYPCLTEMALSLQLSPHEVTFFKIHTHVHHFDSTLKLIIPIWEKNPAKIVSASEFIYSHQYKMWQALSDRIFSRINTPDAALINL